MFTALGIIALWLGSAFVAGGVAQTKGRGAGWFFAGLILGPIGVIGAAGLPDETMREKLEQIRKQVEMTREDRLQDMRRASLGKLNDEGMPMSTARREESIDEIVRKMG